MFKNLDSGMTHLGPRDPGCDLEENLVECSQTFLRRTVLEFQDLNKDFVADAFLVFQNFGGITLS